MPLHLAGHYTMACWTFVYYATHVFNLGGDNIHPKPLHVQGFPTYDVSCPCNLLACIKAKRPPSTVKLVFCQLHIKREYPQVTAAAADRTNLFILKSVLIVLVGQKAGRQTSTGLDLNVSCWTRQHFSIKTHFAFVKSDAPRQAALSLFGINVFHSLSYEPLFWRLQRQNMLRAALF